MRGLQAHPQAPALTRFHGLRQGRGVPAAVVCAVLPVPTQINLRGHGLRQIHSMPFAHLVDPPGLFQLKAKAPTQVLTLRHGLHHAHHIQVLALQRRVDGVRP